MINRRGFLKGSFAGLGVASGLATNFSTFNAFAADASDYKALVCVFLNGGMDGHDTLIPTDVDSSNRYESLRSQMLASYDGRPDGFSRRRRNDLRSLNDADIDGRTFGFPEELRPLQELFNLGQMSVVGNVGPLIEPLNRVQLNNGSRRVPARLGSHNDSSSTWVASQPEGATAGWGGRFSDIMQAANANTNASFSSVSAAGRQIFLTGEQTNGFEVSTVGGLSVDHLDSSNFLGSSTFASNYENILRDAQRNNNSPDLSAFGRDMGDILRTSLVSNELLTEQLAIGGDLSTSFPSSSLGQQLQIIARIISRRQGLGVGRQIFFVQQGGYDTHRNQPNNLPELQQDLGNSLRAFYDATVELGVASNVTSFTASDFGRALQPSRNGTDHGWGNHHMVVGGAVNGGQILGDVPPPILGHDYDQGRGRLIPQVSVDQYAGALGRWYGLTQGEVRDALPGIVNFDENALNGLFS